MGRGIEEEALEAACEVAVDHGLPCGDAKIVYSGSNVLVHLLPSPVVARVMVRTVALHDDPRRWLTREVGVARFLAPTGLAVAPSSMICPGPHHFEGLWMTFSSWVEIEGPTEPRDAEALGEALRNLHQALAEYPGELGGMLDLLEDIERLRLQLPPSPEADSLGRRLFALTDAVFETSLPTQPLHGDASLSNLLRTPLGLLWNDFEDVLRGPVHWDVAGYVMALENAGADAAFVRRALDAYGWDPEQDLTPFTAAHEIYAEIWRMYRAGQVAEPARDGKGTLPSRSRPWQAVTVPERAGLSGVMRDRRLRVTRERREAHGSVTEGSRRHIERGRSTLPRVLVNTDNHDW